MYGHVCATLYVQMEQLFRPFLVLWVWVSYMYEHLMCACYPGRPEWLQGTEWMDARDQTSAESQALLSAELFPLPLDRTT